MKKLPYIFVFCLSALVLPITSYSQYILNGSATQEACNCYVLTQNVQQQSGSVWQNAKIDLNNSFDFSFNVYLGCNDDGADGVVFILQPNSSSIGANGQGLGFQGVVPSIGISLDTYQNVTDDPVYDHISIQANGVIEHDNDLAGPVPASSTSGNIEDCSWHMLRITWDAGTHTLSTYFDGIFRLSTATDIVSTIFNNDPLVYWGFSGSTGVQFNVQKFCTPLNCNFNSNFDDNATCFGNPVILEDQSGSFTKIQNYFWDFGDGTTSTAPNPGPHNYLQPGIYNVKHSITAADGCISEQVRSITVGDTPYVSFNIYDTCRTISPRIENNSTTKIGTISKWDWQLDGKPLPNVAIPGFNNLTAGSHSISLTATSNIGCISKVVTKTFDIKNKPDINIAASDGCVRMPILFTGLQIDTLTTIDKWYWNFGNGAAPAADIISHSWAVKGLFPVQLTAVSTNGCSGVTSKNIFINSANAFAGKDTIVIANTPFQLHGSGGNFYSWSPSTGLDDFKIPDPVGRVNDDIRYLLSVRTVEGCVDTASILVKVFKGSAIYVPTGFTPNNDGRNDLLKPAYIGIKSLSYFTIYNRWGQKVFSTSDLNTGWNGSLHGQNLETGSFVWILQATDVIGKIYSLKGTFTLIR